VKFPGVSAATLFSRKGYPDEFAGLTEAEATEMANLCAAITMSVKMQGRMLARMSDHPGWENCLGWMMWGPAQSVVAVRDSACIAHAPEVRFDRLIDAMDALAAAQIVQP
jgi:roadblock/LC7 domain-containing protein